MAESINDPKALEYQGDVLTEEGWDIFISSLDFLPDDKKAREAFMGSFAVQAARC